MKVRVDHEWTDEMKAVEIMVTKLQNQPYNYLDFDLNDESTGYLNNEVMENIHESINTSMYRYEI